MSFSQKSNGRVQISFEGEISLTEQSHKDSCDIHQILKKSEKSGILEHVNATQGQYGTMPTGEEFHNHMNIIAAAESVFESVPSKLRNKFDNDPAKFLDFISQDKNKSKLDELGLDSSHLKAPPEPKPKVENLAPEVPSQE